MPLATIRYKQVGLVSDVSQLIEALPEILAEHLTSEEAPLDPEEIEVEVKQVGQADKFNYDLNIYVCANEYPDRLASLDQRRQSIEGAIAAIIKKGITFSVWIQLLRGSFGASVGHA